MDVRPATMDDAEAIRAIYNAVFGRIVGHNEVSIAVHRSCGFELVGVEKEVGRKFGQWLDVVEMQRLL
jgi:L-amino acid N-acyltransferase YncA